MSIITKNSDDAFFSPHILIDHQYHRNIWAFGELMIMKHLFLNTNYMNRKKSLHYKKLKKELKKASKKTTHSSHALTAQEKVLLQSIQQQTEELNVNNITRTKAYLDFYNLQPEVKWSLLAHMVSRNAGWNMTDLKGEFLSVILSDTEQINFFRMLERGNWLIFQDAYPQLLLYKESLRLNRPLFHLLPHMGVSIFMETVWSYFWKTRNSDLLSVALIINEQNYIEKRVIQNSDYEQTVLDSLEFKLQEILSMNQILFPFKHDLKIRLLGQTVWHFEELVERIRLGKRLYNLLFAERAPLKEVHQWAIKNPHTGSRKDFWPHLFNDKKETLPGNVYTPILHNCTLKSKSHSIYSPKLASVWKNETHASAEKGDWFTYPSFVDELNFRPTYVNGNIEGTYCDTLESLEFILYANELIFHKLLK